MLWKISRCNPRKKNEKKKKKKTNYPAPIYCTYILCIYIYITYSGFFCITHIKWHEKKHKYSHGKNISCENFNFLFRLLTPCVKTKYEKKV